MGYTMWLEISTPPWRYDPTPSWNFLSGIEALLPRGDTDRGAERPCKPPDSPAPLSPECPRKARSGQNSPKIGHPGGVSGNVRSPG